MNRPKKGLTRTDNNKRDTDMNRQKRDIDMNRQKKGH